MGHHRREEDVRGRGRDVIVDTATSTAGVDGWDPSSFIAACALVFTVASFWWLNYRRGRLRVYEPHSFAAAIDGSRVLFLRFPLVFENTGAAPIVVADLQMRFPDVPTSILPLPWRTTRTQIKLSPDDDPQLPAVFTVAGRTAERHFIEFGGPFPGFQLEAKDYKVTIDARLGHKRDWQTAVTLTLRAGHISFPERYIAYSNSPHTLSKDDQEKANEALRVLLQRLEDPPPPTE